jgi:methyl-accepting chemotaxis protein
MIAFERQVEYFELRVEMAQTNNWSLSVKMAIGFSVPLALMAAIAITVSVLCGSLKNNAVLAKDESVALAGVTREMKLNVVSIQQSLSGILTARGAKGNDDGFGEAKISYKAFLSGLDKFDVMYQSRKDIPGYGKCRELRSAVEEYYDIGRAMAKAYIKGGPEAGNEQMESFDEAVEDLTYLLDPFVESQLAELDNAMNNIASATDRMRSIVIISAIAGLVLGALTSLVITRSVVKTLVRIIDALSQGSGQVTQAAGQISTASHALAEGVTEQAAGLEETSSSLEEMSSMTKQNADNAQQANALATDASKAATAGDEKMSKMNEAIEDIQKSSDETAKIIKVIDEIAFQTNLLALNAAVEAARAGEAGKGFAVVAEEVRNLALRSAEAAKDTSAMIEQSVKNANNGVVIATEVSKVLGEVVEGISKTTDLVGEIAAANSEQSHGVEQINTAINQMDRVTQSNASNAEESASASQELSDQAEHMSAIVYELSAMVSGSSRINTRSYNTAFKTSDHAFHQIAAGRPQGRPAKRIAR